MPTVTGARLLAQIYSRNEKTLTGRDACAGSLNKFEDARGLVCLSAQLRAKAVDERADDAIDLHDGLLPRWSKVPQRKLD
jgi:hypothetical protein